MAGPNDVEKFALKVTRAVGSPTSIVVHTVLFAGSFIVSALGWITFDRMFLFLTTIVSLEAIYLAIFIQMTINYQGASIAAVEKDIDEIQEDIDEIQEDVEDISEDVDEIQKDVDELQEDVEDISEDVEELSEEDAAELAAQQAEAARRAEQKQTLETIQTDLRKLMDDIERLRNAR